MSGEKTIVKAVRRNDGMHFVIHDNPIFMVSANSTWLVAHCSYFGKTLDLKPCFWKGKELFLVEPGMYFEVGIHR